MGVVFTEGLELQWQILFTPASVDSVPFTLALTADTTPFTGAESLGDVSIAEIGGSPLTISPPSVDTITVASGTATATLSTSTISASTNTESVTLSQWFIFSESDSVLLWGGTVSPAWTPSHSGPSSLLLSGITLTLGQCGASPPPPPTVLFRDSFGGATASLNGRVPNVGSPWSAVYLDWVAGNDTCTCLDTDTVSFAMFYLGVEPARTVLTGSWDGASTNQIGIVLGADSAGTSIPYMGLELTPGGGVVYTGQQIDGITSGVQEVTTPADFTGGDWTFSLLPVSGGLLAYFNNVPMLPYTDASVGGPFGPFYGLITYSEFGAANAPFFSLEMTD